MSRFNEDGSEYFGADDERDFLFAINAGHISGLTNNTEASASMHMLLVENKKLGN